MSPEVLDKGEGLATSFTLMWAISGMGGHVVFQILFLGGFKRTSRYITFKSFSTVNEIVSFELAPMCSSIPTDMTKMMLEV